MLKRLYLDLETLFKKLELNKSRDNYSNNNNLPATASVKDLVQEVYDQGQEGSCTANAFCAAYRMLEPDKEFNPSRQYVYYKERWLEDQKNKAAVTDSGADVKDAVSWVCQNGICSDNLWPYNPQEVNVDPPENCDLEAEKHKLGGSQSINLGDLNSIKGCLNDGSPVLIAIGVYSSFESEYTATTGVVPLPNPINYNDPNDPNDSFVGGHEMLIVGYDDNINSFTVLNSWGPSWGHNGYCFIPYAYITNPNLCFELVRIYF